MSNERRRWRFSCSCFCRSCCQSRNRDEGRYWRPRCGDVSKPSNVFSSSGCCGVFVSSCCDGRTRGIRLRVCRSGGGCDGSRGAAAAHVVGEGFLGEVERRGRALEVVDVPRGELARPLPPPLRGALCLLGLRTRRTRGTPVGRVQGDTVSDSVQQIPGEGWRVGAEGGAPACPSGRRARCKTAGWPTSSACTSQRAAHSGPRAPPASMA
jgi:hypothetical protein